MIVFRNVAMLLTISMGVAVYAGIDTDLTRLAAQLGELEKVVQGSKASNANMAGKVSVLGKVNEGASFCTGHGYFDGQILCMDESSEQKGKMSLSIFELNSHTGKYDSTVVPLNANFEKPGRIWDLYTKGYRGVVAYHSEDGTNRFVQLLSGPTGLVFSNWAEVHNHVQFDEVQNFLHSTFGFLKPLFLINNITFRFFIGDVGEVFWVDNVFEETPVFNCTLVLSDGLRRQMNVGYCHNVWVADMVDIDNKKIVVVGCDRVDFAIVSYEIDVSGINTGDDVREFKLQDLLIQSKKVLCNKATLEGVLKNSLPSELQSKITDADVRSISLSKDGKSFVGIVEVEGLVSSKKYALVIVGRIGLKSTELRVVDLPAGNDEQSKSQLVRMGRTALGTQSPGFIPKLLNDGRIVYAQYDGTSNSLCVFTPDEPLSAT